jgi:diamine N-acetyltransferase
MTAIRLRPTTVADLDFVLAAERDPDTEPFLFAWTREQHASALSDPDIGHYIIEPERQSELVGFLLLAGLMSPHDCLELRRIAITQKGQGFGRAALRAVKHFAFVEKGFHRLWLDVWDQDPRARHVYDAEGFVAEGTLRECIKAEGGPSGYESLVIMSMLAAEYRAG